MDTTFIVYWLFSSLSSCVSPSDPTLTVEKVAEVMGEVEDWRKEMLSSDVALVSSTPSYRKSSGSHPLRQRSVVYWENTGSTLTQMPHGRGWQWHCTRMERREQQQ